MRNARLAGHSNGPHLLSLIPHSSFLIPRSGRGFLGEVDLGALELAAIVYIDGLPLGEYIQPGLARLTVAVTGAPRAAKRQLDLRADGPGVDVDDAGGQVAHGPESLVHIRRVDGAGEAVLGMVVDLDGFLQGVHRDQGGDGAEDFFL